MRRRLSRAAKKTAFFRRHQFLVRLGERIVLDQARKMVELGAEQYPQVRRRRLETVNRGGIKLGQVAR